MQIILCLDLYSSERPFPNWLSGVQLIGDSVTLCTGNCKKTEIGTHAPFGKGGQNKFP